ncbi:hypothetical protein OUZ56_021113 [Daphnia magna]|uniref:Secreted protein n=1 Tax=Daphnia magna TaxID=35525 RepID=A0ABQ9ZGC1_9CRUS|nr:hypothetical protein OUZ56_021079 [Daphnia magna]KAK4012011.1 hypothetical protein OUZ56_021113 [Daphnia magna]
MQLCTWICVIPLVVAKESNLESRVFNQLTSSRPDQYRPEESSHLVTRQITNPAKIHLVTDLTCTRILAISDIGKEHLYRT